MKSFQVLNISMMKIMVNSDLKNLYSSGERSINIQIGSCGVMSILNMSEEKIKSKTCRHKKKYNILVSTVLYSPPTPVPYDYSGS